MISSTAWSYDRHTPCTRAIWPFPAPVRAGPRPRVGTCLRTLRARLQRPPSAWRLAGDLYGGTLGSSLSNGGLCQEEGGMEYSAFPVLVVDDDLKADTAAGRAARAVVGELKDCGLTVIEAATYDDGTMVLDSNPGIGCLVLEWGSPRRRRRLRTQSARHDRPRPVAGALAADLRRD